MTLWFAGGPPVWFLRRGTDQAAGGGGPIVHPPNITQWIRCASASTAGSTSISVDVLGAAVENGARLAWSGGTAATVTAHTPPGASTIPVSALPGPVAAGETAVGSLNLVFMRQVLVTMPAPTIGVDGRPTN